MSIVNMLEAKSNLSRLVEAVESGAEAGIVIARNPLLLRAHDAEMAVYCHLW